MRQAGEQIAGAFESIERSILPSLTSLLDALIDSAALARPGVDADLHATELRNTAIQVDALTLLIEGVVSLAQPAEAPRRISA